MGSFLWFLQQQRGHFPSPPASHINLQTERRSEKKKNIRILEIKEILREEEDEEMVIVIPHTEERVSEGIAEEPGKEKEAAIEEGEEKEETEEIGH